MELTQIIVLKREEAREVSSLTLLSGEKEYSHDKVKAGNKYGICY